jgi:hypothetical protein
MYTSYAVVAAKVLFRLRQQGSPFSVARFSLGERKTSNDKMLVPLTQEPKLQEESYGQPDYSDR